MSLLYLQRGCAGLKNVICKFAPLSFFKLSWRQTSGWLPSLSIPCNDSSLFVTDRSPLKIQVSGGDWVTMGEDKASQITVLS